MGGILTIGNFFKSSLAMMNRNSNFRFNLPELGGALGDVGTLLPLMVALIMINRLNATSVLLGVGLFYIFSGLYYRLPMPVQPLKAVSAIAISLGVSASAIGAAGLLMGGILLFLSFTRLITFVVKLFPRPVVRGIQLTVGFILLRKGIELAFSKDIFIGGASSFVSINQFPLGIVLAILAIAIFFLFRQTQRFPSSLALLIFGLGAGVVFVTIPAFDRFSPTLPAIALPSSAEFSFALIALVIPQLPLTLGNAVVGTWDTAKTYFNEKSHRVTPRALTASMGIANIFAGLFGAMPMCHGSGGLTAHYKLGARTGGANLMVGTLLILLGVLFGSAAPSFLSLLPLSVLGTLLAVVGVYHVLLVRDIKGIDQIATAGTVVVTTLLLGNLAFGFGAGILLFHFLKISLKLSKGKFQRQSDLTLAEKMRQV